MSEAQNDEARMTNVEGMTRSDIHAAGDHFVIRHSYFVLMIQAIRLAFRSLIRDSCADPMIALGHG